MVLEKRETVKAGSADAGTVWAGVRVGFASQVKRQLRKGARIAAGGWPTSPRKTVMGLEGEGGGDPSLLSFVGFWRLSKKAGPLFRAMVRNLQPLWE